MRKSRPLPELLSFARTYADYPWTVHFLFLVFRHNVSISFISLAFQCCSCLPFCPWKHPIVSVSICICLIMNHGTILKQNSRGIGTWDDHCCFRSCLLTSKTIGGQQVMNFTTSVHVCLIMDHVTIFHKLQRTAHVTIIQLHIWSRQLCAWTMEPPIIATCPADQAGICMG